MNDTFIALNCSNSTIDMEKIGEVFSYASRNNIDNVVIFFPKLGKNTNTILQCLAIFLQSYLNYSGETHMILEHSDMLNLSFSDYYNFGKANMTPVSKGEFINLGVNLNIQCHEITNNKNYINKLDDLFMKLAEEEKKGIDILHILASDNIDLENMFGRFADKVCFVEESGINNKFRIFHHDSFESIVKSYSINDVRDNPNFHDEKDNLEYQVISKVIKKKLPQSSVVMK